MSKELIKISNILYINLKDRTDRKENIVKQMTKVEYPMKKLIRINAVKKEDGALGCALSHIKALKKAQKLGNKYTLILEDDFMWKSSNSTIDKTLGHILKLDNWDVCLLACNGKVKKFTNHSKVIECQTASAYIININYIPKLLELWESKIKPGIWNPKHCAIDQTWKILQKKDNWISTNPLIGKQMPSYSDIEKQKVDYGV
tara:strand:- start:5240 stop:5845 length:606 start_codon:yes stop_codon:yes gene_type:complete